MKTLLLVLILLVPVTADARVHTSACSSRSFVVNQRYLKVVRALSAEAIRELNLDNCHLDSVTVMLPPAVEVRGHSLTMINGHWVELGAVITTNFMETVIVIRLQRPVGPVAGASGTLHITRVGRRQTRLTVRLNLHVSVRGGPIIRIIARQRTCRETCEATCMIQRRLKKLCRDPRTSILSVLGNIETLLEARRSSMK